VTQSQEKSGYIKLEDPAPANGVDWVQELEWLAVGSKHQAQSIVYGMLLDWNSLNTFSGGLFDLYKFCTPLYQKLEGYPARCSGKLLKNYLKKGYKIIKFEAVYREICKI
jgi:hypothetical protein